MKKMILNATAIKKETNKAILVSWHSVKDDVSVGAWLPKSQIEVLEHEKDEDLTENQLRDYENKLSIIDEGGYKLCDISLPLWLYNNVMTTSNNFHILQHRKENINY